LKALATRGEEDLVCTMFSSPGGSAKALAVLLGVSIALAGCSGVSGRTQDRDGSVSIHGWEPEEPEAEPRSPQPEAPTLRRPEPAREPQSNRGQRVAALAMKYRGAPYQWGSAGASGFDCSGFVRYVYAQVGVSLPHNAAMQYRHGTPVSRNRLEPGDLVFFDRLRHNGIYVGNGRFIHARQTGKRVNIASLDEDWYAARWVGARRL
jgi:cell wall-associated NlpC family hydrolase